MKSTTEVYPWESKTTLIALLGTIGSLLAAAGIVNLTAEQIAALGIVIFPLVGYLRKRSKGAKVVLSKNVLLVVLLVLLAGLTPVMAINPTVPDYQQAYQDALWLNDYGLWKATTMMPLIERATANPDFLPAFVLKAKVLNQVGNTSAAIDTGKYVLSKEPNSTQAWLEVGKAYSTRAWTQKHSPFTRQEAIENYTLAISALTNSTLADPANSEAWLELKAAQDSCNEITRR